ncbi:hypothetical protein HG530_001616 [Fusarium avenaceum]|nr:hypothetical protein HG530_001616 [Fusarium avenaceum]
MRFPSLLWLLVSGLAIQEVVAIKAVKGKPAKVDKCAAAASTTEFSAGFRQPNPPEIQAEFSTSFAQHKWNQDVSTISTGYLQSSPSRDSIRADQIIDGTVTSSVFNYKNTTHNDMVDHTMIMFDTGERCPNTWRGYDRLSFPVFSKKMLIDGGAVLTGTVKTNLSGRGVGWIIMDNGRNILTIYLNTCNVVIGYDYFLWDTNTRIVTDFFNTNTTVLR